MYLGGCGLPDAWRWPSPLHRRRSLGFGSGLNIAALLDLWRRERPANPGPGSIVFSIEAHLDRRREAAARALANLARDAPSRGRAPVERLAAARSPRLPPHRSSRRRRRHVRHGRDGRRGRRLAEWSGPADAWFLDGFAPAPQSGDVAARGDRACRRAKRAGGAPGDLYRRRRGAPRPRRRRVPARA